MRVRLHSIAQHSALKHRGAHLTFGAAPPAASLIGPACFLSSPLSSEESSELQARELHKGCHAHMGFTVCHSPHPPTCSRGLRRPPAGETNTNMRIRHMLSTVEARYVLAGLLHALACVLESAGPALWRHGVQSRAAAAIGSG